MVILEYLNTKIRLVRVWGVPGVIISEEILVKLSAEMRFLKSHTYFREKEIHKYAWASEITEDKLAIDHVLVSEVFEERLQCIAFVVV